VTKRREEAHEINSSDSDGEPDGDRILAFPRSNAIEAYLIKNAESRDSAPRATRGGS